MKNWMLFITQIVISCSVSINARHLYCRNDEVRFDIGETIELPGQCVQLTCATDGNYIMRGCPIPADPKCEVVTIDKSLPYSDCCITKNICNATAQIGSPNDQVTVVNNNNNQILDERFNLIRRNRFNFSDINNDNNNTQISDISYNDNANNNENQNNYDEYNDDYIYTQGNNLKNSEQNKSYVNAYDRTSNNNNGKDNSNYGSGNGNNNNNDPLSYPNQYGNPNVPPTPMYYPPTPIYNPPNNYNNQPNPSNYYDDPDPNDQRNPTLHDIYGYNDEPTPNEYQHNPHEYNNDAKNNNYQRITNGYTIAGYPNEENNQPMYGYNDEPTPNEYQHNPHEYNNDAKNNNYQPIKNDYTIGGYPNKENTQPRTSDYYIERNPDESSLERTPYEENDQPNPNNYQPNTNNYYDDCDPNEENSQPDQSEYNPNNNQRNPNNLYVELYPNAENNQPDPFYLKERIGNISNNNQRNPTEFNIERYPSEENNQPNSNNYQPDTSNYYDDCDPDEEFSQPDKSEYNPNNNQRNPNNPYVELYPNAENNQPDPFYLKERIGSISNNNQRNPTEFNIGRDPSEENNQPNSNNYQPDTSNYYDDCDPDEEFSQPDQSEYNPNNNQRNPNNPYVELYPNAENNQPDPFYLKERIGSISNNNQRNPTEFNIGRDPSEENNQPNSNNYQPDTSNYYDDCDPDEEFSQPDQSEYNPNNNQRNPNNPYVELYPNAENNQPDPFYLKERIGSISNNNQRNPTEFNIGRDSSEENNRPNSNNYQPDTSNYYDDCDPDEEFSQPDQSEYNPNNNQRNPNNPYVELYPNAENNQPDPFYLKERIGSISNNNQRNPTEFNIGRDSSEENNRPNSNNYQPDTSNYYDDCDPDEEFSQPDQSEYNPNNNQRNPNNPYVELYPNAENNQPDPFYLKERIGSISNNNQRNPTEFNIGRDPSEENNRPNSNNYQPDTSNYYDDCDPDEEFSQPDQSEYNPNNNQRNPNNPYVELYPNAENNQPDPFYLKERIGSISNNNQRNPTEFNIGRDSSEENNRPNSNKYQPDTSNYYDDCDPDEEFSQPDQSEYNPNNNQRNPNNPYVELYPNAENNQPDPFYLKEGIGSISNNNQRNSTEFNIGRDPSEENNRPNSNNYQPDTSNYYDDCDPDEEFSQPDQSEYNPNNNQRNPNNLYVELYPNAGNNQPDPFYLKERIGNISNNNQRSPNEFNIGRDPPEENNRPNSNNYQPDTSNYYDDCDPDEEISKPDQSEYNPNNNQRNPNNLYVELYPNAGNNQPDPFYLKERIGNISNNNQRSPNEFIIGRDPPEENNRPNSNNYQPDTRNGNIYIYINIGNYEKGMDNIKISHASPSDNTRLITNGNDDENNYHPNNNQRNPNEHNVARDSKKESNQPDPNNEYVELYPNADNNEPNPFHLKERIGNIIKGNYEKGTDNNSVFQATDANDNTIVTTNNPNKEKKSDDNGKSITVTENGNNNPSQYQDNNKLSHASPSDNTRLITNGNDDESKYNPINNQRNPNEHNVARDSNKESNQPDLNNNYVELYPNAENNEPNPFHLKERIGNTKGNYEKGTDNNGAFQATYANDNTIVTINNPNEEKKSDDNGKSITVTENGNNYSSQYQDNNKLSHASPSDNTRIITNGNNDKSEYNPNNNQRNPNEHNVARDSSKESNQPDLNNKYVELYPNAENNEPNPFDLKERIGNIKGNYEKGMDTTPNDNNKFHTTDSDPEPDPINDYVERYPNAENNEPNPFDLKERIGKIKGNYEKGMDNNKLSHASPSDNARLITNGNDDESKYNPNNNQRNPNDHNVAHDSNKESNHPDLNNKYVELYPNAENNEPNPFDLKERIGKIKGNYEIGMDNNKLSHASPSDNTRLITNGNDDESKYNPINNQRNPNEHNVARDSNKESNQPDLNNNYVELYPNAENNEPNPFDLKERIGNIKGNYGKGMDTTPNDHNKFHTTDSDSEPDPINDYVERYPNAENNEPNPLDLKERIEKIKGNHEKDMDNNKLSHASPSDNTRLITNGNNDESEYNPNNNQRNPNEHNVARDSNKEINQPDLNNNYVELYPNAENNEPNPFHLKERIGNIKDDYEKGMDTTPSDNNKFHTIDSDLEPDPINDYVERYPNAENNEPNPFDLKERIGKIKGNYEKGMDNNKLPHASPSDNARLITNGNDDESEYNPNNNQRNPNEHNVTRGSNKESNQPVIIIFINNWSNVDRYPNAENNEPNPFHLQERIGNIKGNYEKGMDTTPSDNNKFHTTDSDPKPDPINDYVERYPNAENNEPNPFNLKERIGNIKGNYENGMDSTTSDNNIFVTTYSDDNNNFETTESNDNMKFSTTKSSDNTKSIDNTKSTSTERNNDNKDSYVNLNNNMDYDVEPVSFEGIMELINKRYPPAIDNYDDNEGAFYRTQWRNKKRLTYFQHNYSNDSSTRDSVTTNVDNNSSVQTTEMNDNAVVNNPYEGHDGNYTNYMNNSFRTILRNRNNTFKVGDPKVEKDSNYQTYSDDNNTFHITDSNDNNNFANNDTSIEKARKSSKVPWSIRDGNSNITNINDFYERNSSDTENGHNGHKKYTSDQDDNIKLYPIDVNDMNGRLNSDSSYDNEQHDRDPENGNKKYSQYHYNTSASNTSDTSDNIRLITIANDDEDGAGSYNYGTKKYGITNRNDVITTTEKYDGSDNIDNDDGQVNSGNQDSQDNVDKYYTSDKNDTKSSNAPIGWDNKHISDLYDNKTFNSTIVASHYTDIDKNITLPTTVASDRNYSTDFGNNKTSQITTINKTGSQIIDEIGVPSNNNETHISDLDDKTFITSSLNDSSRFTPKDSKDDEEESVTYLNDIKTSSTQLPNYPISNTRDYNEEEEMPPTDLNTSSTDDPYALSLNTNDHNEDLEKSITKEYDGK